MIKGGNKRGDLKDHRTFITFVIQHMKKLLRTLVIILLLVCAFFFIKKNTTRLGSTKIDDVLPLTGEITTSIDLATGTEPTVNNKKAPEQIWEKTSSTAITANQWYLTEVYSDWGKNYLKIDYVTFWPMWPSWAPDIINNNPLIRTFEVSNTAIFNVLKYNIDGEQEPQNIQRNEFEIRWNGTWQAINPDINKPIYYGCWKTSLVEIKHDNQNVYKVTETYRP